MRCSWSRTLGVVCLSAALALTGCGGGGASSDLAQASGGQQGQQGQETSGPPWQAPSEVRAYSYSAQDAQGANGATVDVSHANQGVVFATAPGDVRYKFQVLCGDGSYNYDIPADGSPVACPINLGNGSYTFKVMRNVQGNSYVEVLAVPLEVTLESDADPYLVPTVFCDYEPSSEVVARAKEIAGKSENQGDVVRDVYAWVCDNVTYDEGKATQLAAGTGYVPNPDETLASGKGICLDYSALAGAMLRSLGIPCQVVTGYVDPGDLYHAWNMVRIDGTWHGVLVTLDPDTWGRMDTTFGAAGAGKTVGDGTGYRDRYIY